jgi:hypothetical protein
MLLDLYFLLEEEEVAPPTVGGAPGFRPYNPWPDTRAHDEMKRRRRADESAARLVGTF